MLVLARRPGERVRIGAEVRITIVSVTASHVRIAIEAPDHVAVHREEVFERIEEANRQAARAASAAALTQIEGAFEPGGRE